MVPLYSNPKGYRGAIVVQGAVGSIFQPPEPLDRVQRRFLHGWREA